MIAFIPLSGHDIAHHPFWLVVYIVLCITAVALGSWYGHYLSRNNKQPPWK